MATASAPARDYSRSQARHPRPLIEDPASRQGSPRLGITARKTAAFQMRERRPAGSGGAP